MTLPASGSITFSQINTEIGIGATAADDLSFLNSYILPGIRPAAPRINAFYGLTYFQNNTQGNCTNGNCTNNCNCGNIQCTNCFISGTVNCTNCDARQWLQNNCNCACTYNCAICNGASYNCNCACNCSKIICADLYDKGLMERHIWAADQQYGQLLRKRDKAVYRGYIRWARIITAWMNAKGPDFLFWVPAESRAEAQKTKMVDMAQKIGDPWSKHMAYLMGVEKEDNKMGRILMAIGTTISRAVNLLPRKPKSKRKHGVITVATIWACLYFSYYTALILSGEYKESTQLEKA